MEQIKDFPSKVAAVLPRLDWVERWRGVTDTGKHRKENIYRTSSNILILICGAAGPKCRDSAGTTN